MSPYNLIGFFLIVVAVVASLIAPGTVGAQQIGETSPLPAGRIMHGAAVLGDHIYAVGGILMPDGASGPDDFTMTALRAPIRADGTLGSWEPTTPLPENRHYIETSTVVLEDVLYVVGGKRGEEYTSTALWTGADANGHLTEWKQSPPFTDRGLAFVTTVTTPGHLHVIGGRTSQALAVADVLTAPLEADGSITRWEPAPPLPRPLWFHAAVASGGRLWVWGGLLTNAYRDIATTIYSAPLLASGRIGEWREEPSQLPVPFYGGCSSSAGSFLMSFMPRVAGDLTSDIWFSQIGADALPGAWQRIATELPNRAYFAVATDFRRRRLYVVGGKFDRSESLPDPRVFTLALAADAGDVPEASIPADVPRPSTVAAASTSQGSSFSDALNAVRAREAGAKIEAPVPAAHFGAPRVTVAQAPNAQGGAAKGGVVPRLASTAPPASAGGSVGAGFNSYDTARRLASLPPGRPLLVLFHHPGSKLSREQVAELADSARVQALGSRAVLGFVDVRDQAQLATQLGVVRTPAWLVYDRMGNLLGQSGYLTYAELEKGVGGL